MNNIGIVVLHFQTVKDTIICVNSFLKEKLEEQNLEIVIVDNNSINNSYIELIDTFKNISNIHVVRTEKNLGFAKGNNYGVEELFKIHEVYEYIICCNNDTYVLDKYFLIKAARIIKNTGCDVLGPDIIRSNDMVHQNPIKTTEWTIEKIEKRIVVFKFKILLFSLFPFLCKIDRKSTKNNINSDMDHVQLHGAFIIFANTYLKLHRDVFVDKTFLYLEEDILYLRCKMEHFIMRYDDSISIYHNHRSATNSINPNISKRKIVFLRNQISSLLVLKEILKNK